MDSNEPKGPELSRRDIFKVAATGLVAALPLSDAVAQAQKAGNAAAAATQTHQKSSKQTKTYLFFQPEEAAFIEAAVARLIPADDKWPGALEADVPNYMDKQLAGAWGAGERLYRSGPWKEGLPTQGYQLPFTPAELFRAAIRGIRAQLSTKGTPFEMMAPAQQDAYLKSLETTDFDLDGVPSKVFFSSLWQMTQEGFFSDPVYGGNKDMVSWKMIGFPGAYGSYFNLVDKHGIKIDRAPMSLAQDASGHVHVDPNIPAHQ